MQVSWIDAERIKDLVALIAPQQTGAADFPGLVEIHTTPEALMGDDSATWEEGANWMEPSFKTAPSAGESVVAAPVELEQPELEPEPEMEDDGVEYGSETPQHNGAALLPLSRIRDKLRAIRQRATEAGILTRVTEVVSVEPVPETQSAEPAPAGCEEEPAEEDRGTMETSATLTSATLPQTPFFDIPSGAREVRLAAFAGWARQVLREDGGHLLVMSDDGEVLWGGESKAGLVLSTMMAWGAAIRASALSACETPPLIHQPLASGNVLTVIPCETVVGTVHVAVAAPAGLTHVQADVLRAALCAAMR